MCLLSYLPGGTLLYTSARPYPPFRVCRPIRRTSFPDPPRSHRLRPGPIHVISHVPHFSNHRTPGLISFEIF